MLTLPVFTHHLAGAKSWNPNSANYAKHPQRRVVQVCLHSLFVLSPCACPKNLAILFIAILHEVHTNPPRGKSRRPAFFCSRVTLHLCVGTRGQLDGHSSCMFSFGGFRKDSLSPRVNTMSVRVKARWLQFRPRARSAPRPNLRS